MIIDYPGKKAYSEILETKSNKVIFNENSQFHSSKLEAELIFGDNFEVMLSMIQNYGLSNKFDLIYIDPPFASKNTFKKGKIRTSTISSSDNDDFAYEDLVIGNDFIDFLRCRLILIRELLSENGSLYLHLDSKMGHYIKVILDEIFGQSNFRNDITRIKCNPKNFSRKAFGNVKDVIFFYTKTKKYIWNEPQVNKTDTQIDKLFNKTDLHGRKYTTNPLHAPGETKNGESGKPWKGIAPPKGRHWRNSHAIMDELDSNGLIHWSKSGNPRKIIFSEDFNKSKMQDIWDFKDKPNPLYPTEKNIDMLELIAKTSSNEGSFLMDAFAGSGSFLHAASNLNRRWVGIDESVISIETINSRFNSQIQADLFKNIYITNWDIKQS